MTGPLTIWGTEQAFDLTGKLVDVEKACLQYGQGDQPAPVAPEGWETVISVYHPKEDVRYTIFRPSPRSVQLY
jgi:hypothetical protein